MPSQALVGARKKVGARVGRGPRGSVALAAAHGQLNVLV